MHRTLLLPSFNFPSKATEHNEINRRSQAIHRSATKETEDQRGRGGGRIEEEERGREGKTEGKFQQVSPQVPILLNHALALSSLSLSLSFSLGVWYNDEQPTSIFPEIRPRPGGEPILRRYQIIYLPETRLIFGREFWPSYSSILFNLPRYR